MNLLIFIHGHASAGKDTFVNALKLAHSSFPPAGALAQLKDFVDVDTCLEIKKLKRGEPSVYNTTEIITMPFADEVRKELCRIDPTVDFYKLCTNYAYKTKYRKQLIEIGDGYRKKDPAIWVEKHYVALKDYLSKNNNKIVCIPDVRYSTGNTGDEFEYAKEWNQEPNVISLTVKVKASLFARFNRMSLPAIEAYMRYGRYNPSETSMDHIPDSAFDIVCCNEEDCPDWFTKGILEAVGGVIALYRRFKSRD